MLIGDRYKIESDALNITLYRKGIAVVIFIKKGLTNTKRSTKIYCIGNTTCTKKVANETEKKNYQNR